MLVAISIPIFNSQLEKSREATDAANLRNAYAECSTKILDGDGTATGYSKSISPVQTQDATFTTTGDTEVGGVKLTTITNCKKGAAVFVNVKADGTVTIDASATSGYTTLS